MPCYLGSGHGTQVLWAFKASALLTDPSPNPTKEQYFFFKIKIISQHFVFESFENMLKRLKEFCQGFYNSHYNVLVFWLLYLYVSYFKHIDPCPLLALFSLLLLPVLPARPPISILFFNPMMSLGSFLSQHSLNFGGGSLDKPCVAKH